MHTGRLLLIVVCAAGIRADASARVLGRNPAAVISPPGTPVRMHVENVNLLISPGVIAEVRTLDGIVESLNEDPPFLDDPRSYRINIATAELALSTSSFTVLANRYLFNKPDSPIKDLMVDVVDGHLRQRGKLKGAKFEIVGDLVATPDGYVEVVPRDVKVVGVKALKLMNALGLQMDSLVHLYDVPGVRIIGNNMILDPEKLMPYPELRGRCIGVRIEGSRIVLELRGKAILEGTREPERPAVTVAGPGGKENYLSFRGGRMRVGNLLLLDADLKVTDRQPQDPLLFDILHFESDLTRGYVKAERDLGLTVVVPDAAAGDTSSSDNDDNNSGTSGSR